jgi:hypothetical protein
MFKAFVLIFSVGFASSLPTRAQSNQAISLEDQYLQIYVKMHDAENLEKNGDLKEAYEGYSDCQKRLIILRKTDPQGSADLFMLKPNISDKIADRLVEVKKKLDESSSSTPAKS